MLRHVQMCRGGVSGADSGTVCTVLCCGFDAFIPIREILSWLVFLHPLHFRTNQQFVLGVLFNYFYVNCILGCDAREQQLTNNSH